MEGRLDPAGDDVRLDDVVLRTPGLAGDVRVTRPRLGNLRDEAQWNRALTTAIERADLEPMFVAEISNHEETPQVAAPTRSTDFGEDAIEITVPAPSDGWGQMMLVTDEAGVTTWAFADESDGTRATRGGDTHTYRVRRHVNEGGGDASTRGLFSSVGRKVLAVLAFRLVDRILGEIGEHFVGKWEAKHRPYRLRTFTPDDSTDATGTPLGADMFERLGAGRALLLVHGTFSCAGHAFGTMPRSLVEELHRRYEGRVFAFDHFSLSHSPRRNVEEFLKAIPHGRALELDVICHSRGGLVSRVLAEKQAAVAPTATPVSVRRVVFVATPNRGTPLADREHLTTFIDTYTNLLNFLPDNGVTDVLEGIMTVAKVVASGVVGGLDGLTSMAPNGDFLRWLNTDSPGEARYMAVSADFEPANAGWKQWAKDRLMDAIFKAPNDLVVPTQGVWDKNGSNRFPIDESLSFAEPDGVSHSRFFENPKVQGRVLSWLA